MQTVPYPPHVDIILDFDNDGIKDDALVVEYAYNNMTHYAEGQITGSTGYGALTGAYYATFSDDGNGPASVTDTTFAWLTTGASGPPPAISGIAYAAVDNQFVGGTLAAWKAGSVVTGITSSTKVLRLEIEVDNWFINTDAFVKEIKVNGALSNSVSLEVNVPDIVAISVDPTTINFGTLLPGGPYSAQHTINVKNVGTHTVSVDAAVSGSSGDLFYEHLELTNNDGFATGPTWDNIIGTLAMGVTDDLQTQIQVPGSYTPQGNEEAVLTFEATAIP